jgi:hypothetical protein
MAEANENINIKDLTPERFKPEVFLTLSAKSA